MYQGDLNPPLCEGCGLLRDRGWINPAFTLAETMNDLSYTYDGASIASSRLADVLADVLGADLIPLPSPPGFYLLTSSRIVEFDVEARQTKMLDLCSVCGRYNSVAGAFPVFLRSVAVPLPTGLSRTDVEFGTGIEQHPLLLVDPELGERLRASGLRGVELLAVE